MNTLTKSILVIAFFAALTISLLLLSGTFTGHMDNRWNMGMYNLGDTKWMILPLLMTLGFGCVVLWLVYRGRKFQNR